MGTSFVEFLQLREVGVFSYLFYSLAKSHFNGWECLEARMALFSVPKDLDRVKESLEHLDNPETDRGLYVLLVCCYV